VRILRKPAAPRNHRSPPFDPEAPSHSDNCRARRSSNWARVSSDFCVKSPDRCSTKAPLGARACRLSARRRRSIPPDRLPSTIGLAASLEPANLALVTPFSTASRNGESRKVRESETRSWSLASTRSAKPVPKSSAPEAAPGAWKGRMARRSVRGDSHRQPSRPDKTNRPRPTPRATHGTRRAGRGVTTGVGGSGSGACGAGREVSSTRTPGGFQNGARPVSPTSCTSTGRSMPLRA